MLGVQTINVASPHVSPDERKCACIVDHIAGSFLALPAGMYKCNISSAPLNTTYIFARGDW